MKKTNLLEHVVHGIFLILGLITVCCVLVITIYLVISGVPAIREIGLIDFLFGEKWASTAAEPAYGILPFILTSIYGTAGAIAIGVPIGFLTAVYLAKMAPQKVKEVVGQAVSMLAGIPSVVYGLVGMMVLVPGIRKVFDVPDGASLLAGIPSVVYGLVGMMVLVPGIRDLFGLPDGASLMAAIVVLAIMILPLSSRFPLLLWMRFPRNMRTHPWLWAQPRRKPGSGYPSQLPKAVSRQPWCWVWAVPLGKPWR